MKYQKIAIWRAFLPKLIFFLTSSMHTRPRYTLGPPKFCFLVSHSRKKKLPPRCAPRLPRHLMSPSRSPAHKCHAAFTCSLSCHGSSCRLCSRSFATSFSSSSNGKLLPISPHPPQSTLPVLAISLPTTMLECPLSGIHPGYSCKEGGRVEDGLLLEFPCTPTRTRSV
jgi:hypothetical protein